MTWNIDVYKRQLFIDRCSQRGSTSRLYLQCHHIRSPSWIDIPYNFLIEYNQTTVSYTHLLGDTMKKDINTLFMLAGKRKICNFFIGEDGSK